MTKEEKFNEIKTLSKDLSEIPNFYLADISGLSAVLTTPLPAKIYANEGVAQLVFIRGNEKPSITYAKRKGKYMKQKGVTLPKI